LLPLPPQSLLLLLPLLLMLLLPQRWLLLLPLLLLLTQQLGQVGVGVTQRGLAGEWGSLELY
jgi:hypothetical protein